MSTNTAAAAASIAAAATVVIGACTAGAVLGAANPAPKVSAPDEFAPYIAAGGRICKQIDEHMIAATLEVSSGFDTEASGAARQQGPAQFVPSVWRSVGAEVDDTGRVIGGPGSGDPADPADATMALSRMMCAIADRQAPAVEAGELRGERDELVLAAFAVGEKSVLAAGGVPNDREAEHFVDAVTTAAVAGKE